MAGAAKRWITQRCASLDRHAKQQLHALPYVPPTQPLSKAELDLLRKRHTAADRATIARSDVIRGRGQS